MKRFLGPLLTLVLVIGVGAAVYLSVRDRLAATSVVTVRGLIGSEKQDFFKDQRVIDALRRNGLDVQVQTAGSRQIATSFDLKKYDFAFPAGVPAAEKIKRDQKVSKSYDVFFTPMAIASWKTIAQILQANGVVTPTNQGAYYTLNMDAYLNLVQQDKRWNQLQNSQNYSVGKSVLINTTDVRTSNSAAMYLSLASYVANHDNIVTTPDDISRVMPIVTPLFLKQGLQDTSSAGPFEDYLSMGIGKTPMVMIYEAQFIAAKANPNGGIGPEMVLIYPQPSLYTKHVLVPLSANGDKLGQALSGDADLQHLAVEYGFRTADTATFNNFVSQHGVAVAQSLVDVVEPPSYEVLEAMIQQIEQKYGGS